MKDSDWIILYELYRNPNMTKVANRLYITQPTLTKRLQRMEEEFGVTIVNRISKGLVFTPEGEFLGRQAEKYLALQKETQRELEKMKQKETGVIVVGSSYTYSKYALSDLILKYRANHPEIHFNVVNESSDVLFQRMLEDSIDVGFVRGDYEGPVSRIYAGKNQAYVMTNKPVKLEDLPGMQRLGYKTNAQTQTIIDEWYREQFGVWPPAGMNVGYVDVAWQMVRRGTGYACCFMPEHFQEESGMYLLPMTHLDGTPVTRNTWFVYPTHKRGVSNRRVKENQKERREERNEDNGKQIGPFQYQSDCRHQRKQKERPPDFPAFWENICSSGQE